MTEKRKTVPVTVATFKRWLNAQPPKRTFQYFDCRACMFATYLREHHRVGNPRCTGTHFTIDGDDKSYPSYSRIPKRIDTAILGAHMAGDLTVGNVKRRLR